MLSTPQTHLSCRPPLSQMRCAVPTEKERPGCAFLSLSHRGATGDSLADLQGHGNTQRADAQTHLQIRTPPGALPLLCQDSPAHSSHTSASLLYNWRTCLLASFTPHLPGHGLRKDLVNIVHTQAHLKSTTLLRTLQVKPSPPGSQPNCLWTHKHGCEPKYRTRYWRYREVRPGCASRPLRAAARLTAQQRNVSKQQIVCLQTSSDAPLCTRALFFYQRCIPVPTLASAPKAARGAAAVTADTLPILCTCGQFTMRTGLVDYLLPTGKAYGQMTSSPTSSAAPVSRESP